MKKFSPVSSRLMLAAGAMAALAALPQSASAQLVGGFQRPGAVASPQQPAPGQQSAPQQSQPMRPGPIVRGTVPFYGNAPVPSREPVDRSGPIYGRRPVFNPPPVQNQPPNYGRGGISYYNNNYPGNNYSGNNYSGYGPVVTLPEYPAGNSYGQTNLPPIGPGNGFFRNPIPPVGPANGFFSGQAPITGGGPPRLGGYYYGNYCNVGTVAESYPSVYSDYEGFPQYIDSPNVIVISTPYAPDYATPYLPFYTPVYQTTYNQNNYYVASEDRVQQLQAGGEQAKAALTNAYPANSFQAAFADIAHAWTDGNIDLVRRHLRDPDTRISVFLDGAYKYSIASSDFSQITRDALDKLHTVSFDFTRLRKAKNGDVTAYGSHVYRVAEDSGSGGDNQTVPFDQSGTDGSSLPEDQSGDPALGAEKTVYVSYTLRRYAGEWDIIATDSANHDLAGVTH